MGLGRRLPPVLRQRDYRLFWIALVLSALGGQMVVVAVGWQVYSINHSALDLGLVGLMEFIPLPLLALPAGQLADRVPRRLILAGSFALELVIACLFVAVTLAGADQLWQFLALALATGATAALGMPANRALSPMLVPLELVPDAVTLRSIGFQGAVVAGPAIGGVIFAIRPEAAYATAAVLIAVSLLCLLALHVDEVEPSGERVDMSTVLAGVRFIRQTPVILGAISLDLFAVLFGGAVALLPLFAKSILHTGPVGLGILRSAPAVGALLAGLMLARRPLRGRVGQTLLVVVAAFGGATIVFGLSRSIVLSCAALAVAGFVDMISMNIRSTTVALATPNELRGRVNAVEMVFISASNELGAFESGVAAAVLGAVPAVVAGGAITIGLAVSWPTLFPSLAAIDRFEDVQPAATAA